jgi:hypothetical protein
MKKLGLAFAAAAALTFVAPSLASAETTVIKKVCTVAGARITATPTAWSSSRSVATTTGNSSDRLEKPAFRRAFYLGILLHFGSNDRFRSRGPFAMP